MKLPPVVSEAEWQAALGEIREREKDLTREHDALAGLRRRLPRVRIDRLYVFQAPDGEASMLDLFEGAAS